jgi:hypothetical protein
MFRRFCSITLSVFILLVFIPGQFVSANNPQDQTPTTPNNWVFRTSMPTARDWFAAINVNDNIYAIGGDNYGPKTIVEKYNPESDSWEQLPNESMPTARSTFAATEYNGKIYVFGGNVYGSPLALKQVEVYDPQTGSWVKKNDMDTGNGIYGMAAVSLNDKIYIIGGGNETNNYLNTLWEYNPGSDSWRALNSMATPRLFVAAVALDGKIYAIGGLNSSGSLSSVEIYDPDTNQWTPGQSLQTPRYALAAVVNQGKIYAISGFDSPVVEVFDPNFGTWQPGPPLNTGRSAFAATVANGNIYAIGGDDDTTYQIISSVEEYTPPVESLTITANATKEDGTPYTAGTWTNQTVTVHFDCSDPNSDIASCTADQAFSTDGVTPTVSGTATDVAGNSISVSFGPIQIDKTPPVITFASRTAANSNGWNNSDVTVNWSCSDSGSGPVSATISQIVSTEGAGQSVTGTCADLAGNTASDNQVGFNIDKTKPILNPVISPNPIILNGSATINPGASDALSGIASQSCGSLDTSTVGIKTVTCTATDNAGNSASTTISYLVVTTITMGPQAMEGDLKVNPGDLLKVGYDFTMPGSHPAANLQFVGAQVTFSYTCVSVSGTGTFVVPIPDQAYTDPLNNSGWYPSGDQKAASVFQGSLNVPNVCNNGQIRLQKGGTFYSGVTSSDTNDKVNIRWHYSALGSAGGWSGTKTLMFK